jgi:hypothetical protein
MKAPALKKRKRKTSETNLVCEDSNSKVSTPAKKRDKKAQFKNQYKDKNSPNNKSKER